MSFPSASNNRSGHARICSSCTHCCAEERLKQCAELHEREMEERLKESHVANETLLAKVQAYRAACAQKSGFVFVTYGTLTDTLGSFVAAV